ncbi:MAG: hypothetical protein PF904_01120 [Kiritimatiellae bacterium]|jgi:hypothetical protein|nr:hypothetical protein [Kiritimatiellia bacterium]
MKVRYSFFLSLVISCVSVPAVRGELSDVIGLREIVTTGNNNINEVVSDTILVEGKLRKVGTGSLSIATEDLFSGSRCQWDVLAGTALITSNGSGLMDLADAPAAVLAKAAFWVDATTNVIYTLSNGNYNVSQWLDVREPDTAAPYQYLRAVSQVNFTNAVPEYMATGAGLDDTLPYLWFGGYHSGRWMAWQNPDSSPKHFNTVQHVFAVHGAHDSYGFIFGITESNSTTYPFDFYKDDYGSATGAEGAIWEQSGNGYVATAVRTGRTFLDRKQVDGSTEPVKRGYQLLDVEVGCRPANAGNFFNCRNLFPGTGARVGGDRLCEVLVFTERLTERERVQVEHYLWQKWFSRVPHSPAAFSMAKGATSVVESVVSGTQTMQLKGDGVFIKQCSSTVKLPVDSDTQLPAFNGSLQLADGTLDARYPVALDAVAGNSYDSTGFVVTRGAADAGSIVKSGDHELILSSVPDNVTVTVEQGLLQIAQPLAASWPTEMRGTIPNPTFEGLVTENTVFTDGQTIGGWTADLIDSSSVRLMADSQWYYLGNPLLPYPTPDGTSFLLLKKRGNIQTTINLPVGGVYALSFLASGRKYMSGAKDGHMFDIIVDGATRVATVPTFATVWQQYRYQLPWLAAGSHTLLLKTVSGTSDYASALDDFHLDLVETEPSLNIVSNACFECVAGSSSAAKTMIFSSASGTDWAFSSGGGGGYVNIKCQGTLFSVFDLSVPRVIDGSSACSLQDYGRRNLYVYSDGIASTTIRFPEAGEYTLSMSVARTRFSHTDPSAASELTVSISGCVTQTIATASDVYDTKIIGPFTVPLSEVNVPQTLQLSGKAEQCIMLIDDLRIARVNTANLIVNGSFEEGDTPSWTTNGWNIVINSSYGPIVYATTAAEQSNWGYQFGINTFDGPCRCRIYQTGYAKQSVTFAEVGTYRLAFHAISRFRPSDGASRGRNPIKAWIARNGVTNTIGYVETFDDQYRRHEFLFDIAETGAYEIGLQGQLAGVDRTSLIDAVSVKKVEVDADWSLLATDTTLEIASGAKLLLNFSGMQSTGVVRYDGETVSGAINSATCPEFVMGAGTLYSSPKGTLIMVY